MNQQLIEEIVAPDISHIVTEDDTAVDNFQSAQQQRLLVEPVYSCGFLPSPFVAEANVGLAKPLLQSKDDMNGALLRVWSISPVGYAKLTSPQGIVAVDQPVWLEGVGLGLTLWSGQFEEEVTTLWLRVTRSLRVLS